MGAPLRSKDLLRQSLSWFSSGDRQPQALTESENGRETLTPVLLSGGGRTGSTAIMELLGSDPRVAFDREYPFESRYLLYFVKFAKLLENPELFQFLDSDQLFNFAHLGFGGPPPATTYTPSATSEEYLPKLNLSATVNELWSLFSRRVLQEQAQREFYVEKSPSWLAPLIRECMNCYTIYNFRDPRDIFISANAFMKKRNYFGFARSADDSDLDHARHLALAFVSTFENYYADRKRADTMLLRYEDFVLHPQQVAKNVRDLCGIVPRRGSSSDFFSLHRTAKDLQHTVNRWQSDPIPREVVLFLESALQAEMAELGYVVNEQGNDTCSTISFFGDLDASALPCSADGALKQESDYARVDIRGIDFWILLPVQPFDAEPVKEIWVCTRGEIGKVFSLYWHGPGQDFAEERCFTLGYTPSPHWSVLSFPVHLHQDWRGKITRLRLDLFNASAPPHQGHGRIRWVRLIR